MIEGRTVSTIYGVYAPVKFIHEHTNDIRMSPRFCALGNKPYRKGKERHNPNAYVAKSYEMPKEDNDGSTETADAE